jgi:hypothetical protein
MKRSLGAKYVLPREHPAPAAQVQHHLNGAGARWVAEGAQAYPLEHRSR